MKAFSVFAMMVSVFAASASAKVLTYTYYSSLDFSQKEEAQQNMYDDDIDLPEGYDLIDFGVKFKLAPGESYQVAWTYVDFDGKETPNSTSCAIGKVQLEGPPDGIRTASFTIDATVDADDGSMCRYTVTLSSGKSASIAYFATGT